MNKKGFMMAELIVVSAIVLVFLAGLFISYNKIYSAYKTRIDYYDVISLYRLAYYRDTLINNNQIDALKTSAKNNQVTKVTSIDDSDYSDNVFLIYNNKKNIIPDNIVNENTFKGKYKDYINYLSKSIDLTDVSYVMVLERCQDVDNCKYAYLEVNDET